MKNSLDCKFLAIRENESLARVIVSSFCLNLDPSLDELEDIKTAVSEAVTNVIVHAYPNIKYGMVNLKCEINENILKISVSDNGVGIQDIAKAMTPFYTSRANEERSGMGFTVMESFMDSLKVTKNKGNGVTVTMTKKILGEVESAVEC